MKRHTILAAAVISLFALAWWLGYSVLAGIGGDTPRPKASSAQTTAVTPKVKAKPKVKPASVPSFERSKSGFAYSGWKIDQSGDSPRVCIGFTDSLPKDGNLEITDYIRSAPSTKLTAEIVGNMACLSGLKYGTDYELTLLEGLKSAKSDTLGADKRIDIVFGDRPAHVSFAGNGIILPRISAAGLAIETVNIDTLQVEILRVGDRIIAQQNPDIGTAIAEGDYGRLEWEVSSNVREAVWKGSVDIAVNTNQVVTTVLPISDLVGELKPGAYVVVATRNHEEGADNPTRAWRWIIVTDLAMTSYKSASGLDVTVRSIDTAKPVGGTKVDLIAVNNEILGSQITDGNGRVSFGEKLIAGQDGSAPRMLMAYGGQSDYAILDFNRSPLDLSAFPIGGRYKGKAIDAYAYTERGVYRPGETVNLSAMLRDLDANAVNGRAGKVEYIKPNGVVFRTDRFTETNAGTVSRAFKVPNSAPRGIWSASISVDGVGSVGRAEFSVEDFVPQKLRVAIKTDKTPIRPDAVRNITVQADFLYGAPGAGLETEAEARLRADPKPFPKYADYQFYDASETFREEFLNLGGGITDGKGVAEFGIKIPAGQFETSYPLRAEVSIGVAEPGGRYIKENTRIPVRLSHTYIGIDPAFEGRAPRNKPADFKLVAVDADGARKSITGAIWTLFEEDWNYTWFRSRGRWQYRYDMRDIELGRGAMDIQTDSPAEFTRTLNWGNYRLVIEDPNTGAKSAVRFSVGWRGGNTSDAPDQIQISGPATPVKAGDNVTLSVKSPYSGLGELVIADETVRSVQTVEIPEGGSEIEIKLDRDLGASAYALLTVYTPRDVKDRPLPRRAVGVTPIEIDKASQTLSVKIDAPKRVRPRQTQSIDIDVSGIPAREQAYLTLAAVDEGILQITKFKSPNPEDWYFGKAAFGIDVRDDYARLLNPNLGDPALAKSGGDGLGGEGLTVIPEKMLSLYSGPVSVKNGETTIKLDLPDFNGEVRLMAVVWSDTAVGSDVKPMVVRDAVPATLALPRFMAPGDKAFATLSLDNVEGDVGGYAVGFKADDILLFNGLSEKLHLEKGERKSIKREIIASQSGISDVAMTIDGPGRYKVSSDYQIQTRTPFRPVARMITKRLDKGGRVTLDQTYIEGLDPGSVDMTVSFSRTPGLDPSAYAASVSQYPYGCTEQTVSRAMPLLYAGDIGGSPNMSPMDVRAALQEAVDRVSNRQGGDGAFGLWRPGDRYARPWIGVYAIDFLQRAEEKEYLVSADVLDQAYNSLRVMTKMHSYPSLDYRWNGYRNRRAERQNRQAESAAYAHYVLARAGRGDLSSMRYFFDNHTSKLKTPMAWGHLGAALAMMDDKSRSTEAFDKAVSLLGYEDDDNYYQTSLRDIAGVMAVANEVGAKSIVDQVQQPFIDELKPPNRLSTQEKAQTILAIRSQLLNAKPIDIESKDIAITSGNGVAKGKLLGTELAGKPVLRNKSGSDVWYSVLVQGAPIQAPTPVENGFDVFKRAYAYDSLTPIDPAKVNQGDKFVILVSFSSTKNNVRQAVLADLLPAGLEIETILNPEDGARRDGNKGAFAHLGELTTFQVAEARDDRLVAAVETYRDENHAIAYVVRAVTEGDFIWPGAVVEDMYRPQEQSITASTRINIGSGPEG